VDFVGVLPEAAMPRSTGRSAARSWASAFTFVAAPLAGIFGLFR